MAAAGTGAAGFAPSAATTDDHGAIVAAVAGVPPAIPAQRRDHADRELLPDKSATASSKGSAVSASSTSTTDDFDRFFRGLQLVGRVLGQLVEIGLSGCVVVGDRVLGAHPHTCPGGPCRRPCDRDLGQLPGLEVLERGTAAEDSRSRSATNSPHRTDHPQLRVAGSHTGPNRESRAGSDRLEHQVSVVRSPADRQPDQLPRPAPLLRDAADRLTHRGQDRRSLHRVDHLDGGGENRPAHTRPRRGVFSLGDGRKSATAQAATALPATTRPMKTG